MLFSAIIILLAFMLDLILGDAAYRLHPTRLIGSTITSVENFLGMIRLSRGIYGGFILVLAVQAISISFFLAVHALLYLLSPWAALAYDLYIVFSCIALKDLTRHTIPISKSLDENDVLLARKALQKIVGRDASVLDEDGIARATVECVSESFVDSILSPIFYFTIGSIIALPLHMQPALCGTLGILFYKTANTMDSMVGYRNRTYRWFGACAARLDDVLNFIPARLSILMLFIAAHLAHMDAYNGLRTAMRDRLKHASPNSGHSESFAAGILGVKLGGPSKYSFGMVDKPWMGDGSMQPCSYHIWKTCKLVIYSSWLSTLSSFVLLVGIKICEK